MERASVSILEVLWTGGVATLVIALLIKYSFRLGLLDIPNARSSHVAPTPRGAGVGIYLGFILALMLFQPHLVAAHWGFFLAQFLVFGIGVYDDYKEASPKLKFIFIILATIMIFFIDHLQIDTLGRWFGYRIDVPLWIALPLTIFAVTGYTNALNLIDGLDGLAGGISLIIFLAFFYLGVHYHDPFMISVSLVMTVALIAFLLFNWHPASIFMGDSGSLVLGFTIAAVAIRAISYVSVTSILFLAALPILDTIVVMVRRIQRGVSPFSPDKTHLHHKVVLWRKNVDYSVVLLLLVQMVFSLSGIYLHDKDDAAIFALFILVLLLFFALLDERISSRNEFVLTRLKRRTLQTIQARFSDKALIAMLLVFIAVLTFLDFIR